MIIKNVILNKKVANNIWQEILVILIAYSTIFNFTYLENMQYVECMVMSFSILFYTISAKKLVFNKQYFIAGILSLFATLCYQGTIGWFITITLLFSLIEHKKINKEVIKNVIIAGIFCVISVGINLLQIKICGKIFGMTQNRMGSIANILNNIKNICNSMFNIYKNTFGLFHKNLFLAFLSIILLISVISIKSKQDRIQYINLIIITIVSIIISFTPNIFTKAAFGTARMSFSIGATIGIMLLHLYCNTDIFQKKRIIQKLLIIIAILYCAIININYVGIMIEHKKVNKLTEKEAKEIGGYLNEYEENSNVELKNIIIVYDSSPSLYYYSETKNRSTLNYRPLYTEWSHVGTINYYTSHNLKWITNINDKYTEELKRHNWDKLDKEQFIFVGDTVYYCIY